MKRISILLTFLLFSFQFAFATVYYVSLTGNDASGDGSSARPWRTLQTAVSRVPANQGHTIKILAGTFVENAYINVPTGVNIEGSGIGVTIIKPGASLYFKSNAWDYEHYLIRLIGGGAGNQSVKNLTLDGVSKQLYGGLLVKDRTHVLIQGIRVQYFYFTGIWIHGSTDSRITQVQLKDNAWGGGAGSSGSMILGSSERLEVDHLTVDEKYGQALDCVTGKMYDLKVHDNRFSVSPQGQWIDQNGNVPPNLCVEMFGAELKNVEIYDNYFDNSLSLVMFTPSNGIPTVRVYNNVFDMITRAGGAGYGIELTANDAEIDHNYFWGGSTGIVNWEYSYRPAKENWKIHHNTFYGLASGYPGAVITFYQNGINNAHIYNNTVETTGSATISFIEANYSGVVKNTTIENNLIIDSNTSYQWHPNRFISLNNVTAQNVIVKNNFLQKMPIGSVAGVTYSNNLSGDPQIERSGDRPAPYYTLKPGSPLIDAGTKLNFAFRGAAPDIGAYEYGGETSVSRPRVSITKPLANATYSEGETITITAEATSANSSISKVEFFQGTTKLGEDNASPYAYQWTNVAPGGYSITARATDDAGETGSSSAVNVKVNGWSLIPALLQAESYSNMAGIQTENTTDTNGGQNVGWIETGDWLEYTVKVATAGNYTVLYRVASESGGGTIRLESNGTIIATTAVPETGGWQTWNTVSTNINLAAGTQTLKLYADKGGFNINWLEFKTTSKDENTPPVITISKPLAGASFIAPADVTVVANATDNGKIAKVEFFQGSTLLGTDTTSPYSYIWKSVAQGAYVITAKATDDAGAVSTSSAVKIDVATKVVDDVEGIFDIPGIIQAEKYSEMNGVYAAVTTDEGAGECVGSFEAGDWMDYHVRVSTAGEYSVQLRVAGLSEAVVELKNGDATLATVQVPATGGWQTWTTVNASVKLAAGDQTLRVTTKAGALNLNWMNFAEATSEPAPEPEPSAFAVPGLIQAESYKRMSGIDLESTTDEGGGKNVGWIEAGDWLEYYVNVATSGTYNIESRVSSLFGGGSMEVLSGEAKLATINVPATGAWQTWATVKEVVYLEAGIQTLKVFAPKGGYNINWINFTMATSENATVIPGLVEAEEYKAMNGVEPQPTEDVGGGENVGWIDGGDWMDYLVNVTTAGTYLVEFRVASESLGGSVQLQSGSNVLNTIIVPITGAWQKWSSVLTNVRLTEGIQTLRIHALSGPVNINWIKFVPAEEKMPFEIPGKIQAEDYHRMNGIQTEETTDAGGGHNVGWIEAGDWLEYEVVVSSAGTYRVEFRVSSLFGGSELEVKIGENTVGSATVPSTSDWQKWITISTLVNLTEGKQTIRLQAGAGGLNINWLQFSSPTPVQTASGSDLLRIFSPNNDGINDTWTWTNSVTEGCTLAVYNQWGEQVYNGTSLEKTTWDGTSEGQPLQEAAYYYIINCGSEQTTGAVQILR